MKTPVRRTVALLACVVGCQGSSDVRSDEDGGTRRGVDAHARDGAAHDAGGEGHDAARPHDARRAGDAPLRGDARDAVARDTATSDAASRDAESADARLADAADSATDAGAPTATTLSLSLPLTPSFSTSIHDYYVRCAADENAILVSMTAARGSTIGLLSPISTPPAAENVAAVEVAAGGAIVVGVTTMGTTTEYWVRCLPSGFPELSLSLHPDAGTPTPGYYLLGSVAAATSGGCYAMVLDQNAVPVWYASTTTDGAAIDVDNLLPGTLSFTAYASALPSSPPETFELHALSPRTTTYVEASGGTTDFHELQIAADGNYLVIADVLTPGVDLTGLGSYGANETIADCVIQEIDQTGAMAWQWNAFAHFDPVQDSTFPEPAYSDGTMAVDVFHCNAIDVTPNGDLLVSTRNMDSVFLVSRSTGKLVWKMGGASFNKDDAPYLAVQNDPQTSFYRQHDARLHADGTVSLFDDQTEKPGPARAVIYSIDVAAGTASMVWQYLSTATSDDMGSFRILADGSRVIDWGFQSSPHLTFTEVNESGQDLLDFSFPDFNWSYRTIKVPTTAFDVGVLRSTSGGS